MSRKARPKCELPKSNVYWLQISSWKECSWKPWHKLPCFHGLKPRCYNLKSQLRKLWLEERVQNAAARNVRHSCLEARNLSEKIQSRIQQRTSEWRLDKRRNRENKRWTFLSSIWQRNKLAYRLEIPEKPWKAERVHGEGRQRNRRSAHFQPERSRSELVRRCHFEVLFHQLSLPVEKLTAQLRYFDALLVSCHLWKPF